MYYFVYSINIWMTTFLTIFRRSPTTFERNCSKGETSRTFSDDPRRKRTIDRREPVSFLIQKRVRKYRTKHFPSCNLFILYLLKFSPSTRFLPFIRHNKWQVMFLFRLSASTLSLLQTPSVNIFLYRMFASSSVNTSAAFYLFPLPCFF